MGIREVRTAPRSPWQNPYAERVIGSVRRECLNHLIVLNDSHLRRILKTYFRYYHESRTHLSLDKDAPASREIQPTSLFMTRGAGKPITSPANCVAGVLFLTDHDKVFILRG